MGNRNAHLAIAREIFASINPPASTRQDSSSETVLAVAGHLCAQHYLAAYLAHAGEDLHHPFFGYNPISRHLQRYAVLEDLYRSYSMTRDLYRQAELLSEVGVVAAHDAWATDLLFIRDRIESLLAG